jgi:hypothetical protein
MELWGRLASKSKVPFALSPNDGSSLTTRHATQLAAIMLMPSWWSFRSLRVLAAFIRRSEQHEGSRPAREMNDLKPEQYLKQAR